MSNDRPAKLVPVQDPGTPTVSNAVSVSSRTLIRCLQLELRDQYNNASGATVNGKVHVEVINCGHVDEVPVLVGNTTRLQLALVHGRVTVQVGDIHMLTAR